MLRIILVTCVGCVVFAALFASVVAHGAGVRERSWATTPGKQDFDSINTEIVSYHGSDAIGNSETAKSIGQAFSSELAAVRAAEFTEGDSTAVSLSANHFITYCHHTDTAVLIICHVPQLRKFTTSAKDSLMQFAWGISVKAIASILPDYKGRIYVGLRGVALYYQVWIGSSRPNPDMKLTPDTGLPAMYTLFAPLPRPAPRVVTPPMVTPPTAAPKPEQIK